MAMKSSAPLRPEKSSEATKPVLDWLSPRFATLAATALLLASVCTVYAPSLNFQFILDDHRFTNDPRIQMPDHIWEYFSSFVWAQFTGGPPSFYRPVFLLWMRINFLLSALSPWGWHLLSIAKHVAVAALLGLLVWKLLRDRMAALLAAALFALHPAQAESVAWVTVPDPLMAAGVLASLLSFWKYREDTSARQGAKDRQSRSRSKAEPSTRAGLWLAISATFYAAALLAKETAIVFSAVIFAAAFFLPESSATPSTSSKAQTSISKAQWSHALRQSIPFAVVTAIYLLMRLGALDGKLGASTQHLPWTNILLSWPGVLWFYAKTILWPVRSYAFANGDVVEHFSAREVLLPLFAVVVIIALLFALMTWCWKRAGTLNSLKEANGVRSALLVGFLLLVMPILPALNINALNPGDFLHGRYTYLPLAGLMMVLAAAWHLSGKMRIALACCGAVIAIVLAMLTFSQEKMWKDDLSVFTTAHALARRNAPVARNLADAQVQQALLLEDEGRCDQAVPVFRQVADNYPQDWYAWAALGVCQVQLNDLAKAEESLRRAAEISHDARVLEQWRQLRAHMGLPDVPLAK
jgi:hypothetical protein